MKSVIGALIAGAILGFVIPIPLEYGLGSLIWLASGTWPFNNSMTDLLSCCRFMSVGGAVFGLVGGLMKTCEETETS